jgi:hypothetical protein
METTTPPSPSTPRPAARFHGVRILDLSRLVAGNMLLGEHTDVVLGEAGFDTDANRPPSCRGGGRMSVAASPGLILRRSPLCGSRGPRGRSRLRHRSCAGHGTAR